MPKSTFFSMASNSNGPSVGNFVNNMKRLGEVPADIKKALVAREKIIRRRGR